MNNNENASKTNAQKVRKQNAASAQEQTYNAEFASETDAQEVKRQNSEAESRKNKNAGNYKNQ